MNGVIKFYHPEETFVYHIKKSFCKVIYQNKTNLLTLEIESTDDLDHVEEDSLQNEFPEVIFNIDDFSIPYESIDDLVGKSIEIPYSYEEKEDEEGEIEQLYYTNLNVNDEDDLETDENTLQFLKDEKNNLQLTWRGFCDDFTNTIDERIKFKITCTFNETHDEIAED